MVHLVADHREILINFHNYSLIYYPSLKDVLFWKMTRFSPLHLSMTLDAQQDCQTRVLVTWNVLTLKLVKWVKNKCPWTVRGSYWCSVVGDVRRTRLIKSLVNTRWIYVYYYRWKIPQFLCRSYHFMLSLKRSVVLKRLEAADLVEGHRGFLLVDAPDSVLDGSQSAVLVFQMKM